MTGLLFCIWCWSREPPAQPLLVRYLHYRLHNLLGQLTRYRWHLWSWETHLGTSNGGPGTDLQSKLDVMIVPPQLIAQLDPVRVYISILGLLCDYQNFHSLILRPNISYDGTCLPDLNNVRLLSFHLVSNRRLGYDGKCMQARCALLDPVQRHRRDMHRYQ